MCGRLGCCPLKNSPHTKLPVIAYTSPHFRCNPTHRIFSQTAILSGFHTPVSATLYFADRSICAPRVCSRWHPTCSLTFYHFSLLAMSNGRGELDSATTQLN